MCVHAQLHTQAHRHAHTHMFTNPHSAIIHNHVFWRHDVTHLSSICIRYLRFAQFISLTQNDRGMTAHYSMQGKHATSNWHTFVVIRRKEQIVLL